jgi:two-component system sensor histidine kinase KdpD
MSGFRRVVIPVLRGGAVLALITIVAYRLHLNSAATGFLYLIAVVLNCLDAGWIAAATVSVVAVGCLDYFFIEPLFNWTVNDPVDVAALASFSVTSLVVSHLASKAREEAKAARRERQNLMRLYVAAQRLLALDLLEGAQERIIEVLRKVFELEAACIFDAASATLHTAGADTRRLGEKTRETYIVGKDSDEPAQRRACRCLRSSGRTVGAIGFQGLDDPAALAGPMAALASAAIDRAAAERLASEAAAEARAEGLRAAILDALAHEFKTPLATILTAAGGLREAGPLRPPQVELAELVASQAERLNDLSSRLLRLARLDSEEVKPRLAPCDLVPIVAEIVERYRGQWPERQFLFEEHGAAEDVQADAGLLDLAISQLVDNAGRYSPAATPVKVYVEFTTGWASVLVSNSGKPIPPAEVALIFGRFYRGSAARQSTSGTGLGLYVARKIAVAHGGFLELVTDSQENTGVTFRLSLPATEQGV